MHDYTINAKPKYFRKSTGIESAKLVVKEWTSPTYGNTYFSAKCFINEHTDKPILVTLPFQYGYGNYVEHAMFQKLIALKIITSFSDVTAAAYSIYREDVLQKEAKNFTADYE